MKFRILGPLDVVDDDGRVVPLGGPQRRVLLTALLLEANRVVPDGELIEAIWGEPSPDGALATLRTHVSELRRQFAGQQAGSTGNAVLDRVGGGYVLRVGTDQTDEADARALLEAGRRALADSDATAATDQLAAALRLWRGAPLGDAADRPFASGYARRLDELRSDIRKCKIDADLALGRHRAVVGELVGEVADSPQDEGLRRRLALALYYDERQDEAARTCREGLEILYEQGLDSASLQQLQTEILHGTVAPPLGRAEPVRAPAQPPVNPPASQGVSQLPPDIGNFTGREADVYRLLDLLSPERESAPPVVVGAIAGKAGVGKTALAIRVAHELRPMYPDAVLYVDLHGTLPTTLDPFRVLGRFLNALGVARSALPDELDELVALYREKLAGLRVLVVLDNAATEAQVRPLLPGVTGCAAIVTSRRRLSGLDAQHSVVNVLRPEQAVELLGKVVGRERVEAEPEPAQAIVGLCGYLPLAVCIAGSKLASRPFWRLTKLVQRLSDERDRLDELEIGDLEVRASFALSYDERPEDEQQAFRLLGLLDPSSFTSWVAAAMLDLDLDDAEEVVERLADAQLLERRGEDLTGQLRYRFHDLLRVYARERVAVEETAAERHAALGRGLSAYYAYARRAADLFAPGDSPLIVPSAQPAWRAGRSALDAVVGDPVTWYGVERLNLLSVVLQASAEQLDELTWLLATTLVDLFEISGNWTDWAITHEHALEATQRAGDRAAEASVLCKLGRRETVIALESSVQRLDIPRMDLGEISDAARSSFGQAENYYRRAETLYRELDHELGVAVATRGLADARTGLGRAAEAVELYDRALPTFARLGRRISEASAFARLGVCYGELKQFDEAVTCLDNSRSIAGEAGHRWFHATALRQLGDLRRAQGRNDAALRCYEECLPILRSLPDPLWEARVRTHRGDIFQLVGEPALARRQWDKALALLRGLGSSELSAVEARLAAPDMVPAPPKPGEIRHWPRLPYEYLIERVAESRRVVRFNATWSDLLLDERAARFSPALRSALTNGAIAKVLLVDPESDGAEMRTKALAGTIDVPANIRVNLRHLRELRATLDGPLQARLAVRLQRALPGYSYFRYDGGAFLSSLRPGKNTADGAQQELPIDSALVQFQEQQMDELWSPEYSISLEDYDRVLLSLSARRGATDQTRVPYVLIDEVRYVSDPELFRRLREEDIDRVALIPPPTVAGESPSPRTVFPRSDDSPAVRAAFERKYGELPGEVLRLDSSRRLS